MFGMVVMAKRIGKDFKRKFEDFEAPTISRKWPTLFLRFTVRAG
jgi:hypothetical protein